jgi:hypothetical protein
MKLRDPRRRSPAILSKDDEELRTEAQTDLAGAPAENRQPRPARPALRLAVGVVAQNDDAVQTQELGLPQAKSSRPCRQRSARSR